ncbi:MAG: hypothetical protein V1821_00830 [bacterium]
MPSRGIKISMPNAGEWGRVIVFGLITAVLALGFSFVGFRKTDQGFSFIRLPEYSSRVQLLVIQPPSELTDTYTAIRATEQLSKNLAEVIGTTSFFDRVMKSGSIDKKYFSSDDYDRRKEWRRMVGTEVAMGSGILSVSVFHPDKSQAALISGLISQVLVSDGYNYLGSNVTIQEIDAPLTSRLPVRPNLVVNCLTGLILGGLLGLLYVFWQKRPR